jgi:hypothetical protein
LQRLRDLDASRVGNVENILIPHLELGRQEITLGIS